MEKIKQRKKLFIIGIIGAFLLLAVGLVVATNLAANRNLVHAYAEYQYAEIALDNEQTEKTKTHYQAYLRVHFNDGTRGIIIDESAGHYECEEKIGALFLTGCSPATPPARTRVRGQEHGNDFRGNIVVVFLGDGFTAGEQDDFVARVEDMADYMTSFYPFSLFQNSFIVYAVHTISAQSGISGELNGVYSPGHNVNTYFNAYFATRASAGRVILEMSSSNRSRARNHATNITSYVNMVQILANAGMRGGTGQLPTSSQPLGVALTSVNNNAVVSDWRRVVIHEFGHTFGWLWDEYWNGLNPSGRGNFVNVSTSNNRDIVPWSRWYGHRNVGVFYKGTWAENTRWYRVHQNCNMRAVHNQFCVVCAEELIRRMGGITGKIPNAQGQALVQGLQFWTVARHGLAGTRSYDMDFINNNPFPITVTYNYRLAHSGDAINFTGLRHLRTRAISENTRHRVHIQQNGTARYIATRFSFVTGHTLFNFVSVARPNNINETPPTQHNIQNQGVGFNVSGTTITSPRAIMIGDIFVPHRMNGAYISTIGASAFANQTRVTNIELPKQLQTIGPSAFANQTQLAQITLPATVKTKCVTALSGTSANAVLPEGIRIVAENGIFVRHANSPAIWVLAGNWPIHVSSWTNVGGPHFSHLIPQEVFNYLSSVPDDGTFVLGHDSPAVYQFIGGYPLHVSNWASVGGPHLSVLVDGAVLRNVIYSRIAPIDGTLVRPHDSTAIFIFEGGTPIWLPSFESIGGFRPYTVVDGLTFRARFF